MYRYGIRTIVSALLMGLLVACAHYPLNVRNETFHKGGGYQFDALSKQPENTDSLFLCLAFSGGGTRAAALAYGVMQELKNTPVVVDGVQKSLLDEVDCISSVSGGSFTSAYYGLFRDRLFQDFRTEFLEKNIQSALTSSLFNPVNLWRIASPYYGRIDMAAEYYDDHLFGNSSYSRLMENGRPFIIINATNLGPGRRFDFTQDHFDAIGSSLESYQVARAVAASSAFPFLLGPISLKNYPTAEGYDTPGWYKGALEPKDWTGDRYDAAANLSVYLDKDNKYIHLMDGGLADNIGARAIIDAYRRGFIRSRINMGDIEQFVVIVVNARTQSGDKLGQRESPPGIVAVAGKTATVAMDNYSYDSVAQLRSLLYERVQAQKDMDECTRKLKEHCPNAPTPVPFAVNMDPYVIEVNFKGAAQIPGEDPRYYLDLPTSFKLTSGQVDTLVSIGPKLMQASPQYQCLLRVLEANAAGQERPAECPMGAGIVGQ